MASQSAQSTAALVPLKVYADPVVAVPRDRQFTLADVAFRNLLPVARSLRSKVLFVAVGFDPQSATALQAVYGRNGIAGVAISPLEPVQAIPTPFPPRRAHLAGPPGGPPFVCLSVLGCTSALVTLGAVFDGTFRPGLIHVADAASFDNWAEIRDAILARNYAPAGDFEGGEVYIDAPLFSTYRTDDDRPTMATFDVFDTLIARRCLEPWRIFQAVGDREGIPDFVEQRRAAEERVLVGTYRRDDVYAELARHYGWSASYQARVQALELECECAAVLPIAENVARVKDGDLLISDMVLGEDAVRTLLARAGVSAHVGLLAESQAKSSERIWPLIKQQFNVSRHLGDHPHADVRMAAQFGIQAELTKVSEPTVIEQTLLEIGLRDLALLCREARLRSWHPDPTVRMLQLVQASLNFPLLLLASVTLARRATALGCRTLLFSARGCNLWQPLFDALQPHLGVDLQTRYFLTSRVARKTGSDAYLAYARQNLAYDALVVDLCGTGSTMAGLAERLGLPGCDMFLIDHRPSSGGDDHGPRTPETCRVHSLLARRGDQDGTVLEFANMAEHGMVLDMRSVGGALTPVFGTNKLSAFENLAIQEQRKCFLASIDLIGHHDLRSVFELDEDSVEHLCAALHNYMARQADAFRIFFDSFAAENAKVRTVIA